MDIFRLSVALFGIERIMEQFCCVISVFLTSISCASCRHGYARAYKPSQRLGRSFAISANSSATPSFFSLIRRNRCELLPQPMPTQGITRIFSNEKKKNKERKKGKKRKIELVSADEDPKESA